MLSNTMIWVEWQSCKPDPSISSVPTNSNVEGKGYGYLLGQY